MLAAKQGLSDNWFFCRRLFQHATSQFLTYPADQLTVCAPSSSAGKRRPEEGADSGDTAVAAAQHNAPVPNKRQNKASAQTCQALSPQEGVIGSAGRCIRHNQPRRGLAACWRLLENKLKCSLATNRALGRPCMQPIRARHLCCRCSHYRHSWLQEGTGCHRKANSVASPGSLGLQCHPPGRPLPLLATPLMCMLWWVCS